MPCDVAVKSPEARIICFEADDYVAEGRDCHRVSAHGICEVPCRRRRCCCTVVRRYRRCAEETWAPAYYLECVAWFEGKKEMLVIWPAGGRAVLVRRDRNRCVPLLSELVSVSRFNIQPLTYSASFSLEPAQLQLNLYESPIKKK